MEWVLRAIGAFYIFAGVVVLRQAAVDRLLDQALLALSAAPEGTKAEAERRQTLALRLIASLTLAGGLALLTLSLWAVALFAACSLVQAGYLVWARRTLPPGNPIEARGRRATINAFLVYLAAFGLVLWAAGTGLLGPWEPLAGNLAAPILEPAALAAVTGAIALVLLRQGSLNSGRTRSGAGPNAPDAGEPGFDDSHAAYRPEHLRLAPEYECWPLWDDATGTNLNPATLGLPASLVDRIREWDDQFQATFDREDPAEGALADPEIRRGFAEEGEAIAVALREIWPGTVSRRLEIFEPD